MSELLAPPDVEPAVVEVLTPCAGWVGTKFVDHAAGSIRVSATGGGSPVDVVVASPTVLVECWHEDAGDAWRIAATAHATLTAAAGQTVAGVVIRKVDATLPNNNPDLNRRALVRFQFIATVHSRMTVLEV